MGKIAEDMINGVCCSICGQYFTEDEEGYVYEHGYPVACYDCWGNNCGYPKADVETL